VPTLARGPRAGERAGFVLLGLGKLGGREINYHSDLDLLLVYEGDGHTVPAPGAATTSHFEPSDNFTFFTELARAIIRAMSFPGTMGRLYQVDMRLRPTGRSGSLVLPLDEFARYYVVRADEIGRHEPIAQLWERLALTRARPVFGDSDFARSVMTVVDEVCRLAWQPGYADGLAEMRRRLEASRGPHDLKRGPGGLMDVEMLVELLSLKHGASRMVARVTNTRAALEELARCGLLAEQDAEALRNAYDFLLRVQGRLRIASNRAVDDVPGTTDEVEKLARRLGYESSSDRDAASLFLADLRRHTERIRELFLLVVERERAV